MPCENRASIEGGFGMSLSAHSANAIAAIALAVGLSGCGSMSPSGGGNGASQTAYGYVADIRRAAGLPPLVADSSLEKAALQQSRYMAGSGRMVHTTGWGKDFSRRMNQNGVAGPAAENIAAGRMDMAKVFQMWMDSPPHRRNMLDPRMTKFGLAAAGDKQSGRYWTLVVSK
jgi:uncharacterized protein YkwD